MRWDCCTSCLTLGYLECDCPKGWLSRHPFISWVLAVNFIVALSYVSVML